MSTPYVTPFDPYIYLHVRDFLIVCRPYMKFTAKFPISTTFNVHAFINRQPYQIKWFFHALFLFVCCLLLRNEQWMNRQSRGSSQTSVALGRFSFCHGCLSVHLSYFWTVRPSIRTILYALPFLHHRTTSASFFFTMFFFYTSRQNRPRGDQEHFQRTLPIFKKRDLLPNLRVGITLFTTYNSLW